MKFVLMHGVEHKKNQIFYCITSIYQNKLIINFSFEFTFPCMLYLWDVARRYRIVKIECAVAVLAETEYFSLFPQNKGPNWHIFSRQKFCALDV
jgi:hypothetical protein